MFEALRGLDAWITAFRRDSSPTRATAPIVDRYELEPGSWIVKVNPVANWTRRDTWAYLKRARPAAQPALRPRLRLDRLRAVHADVASRASPSARAGGPACRSGSAGSSSARPRDPEVDAGGRPRSPARPRPRAPRGRGRPPGGVRSPSESPSTWTGNGVSEVDHARASRRAVVDVATVDVPRRAEHLPGDPRHASAGQLADREHVQAGVERRLGRHPDPPVPEVRVGVGPSDHHRQRRERLARRRSAPQVGANGPRSSTSSSRATARNAARSNFDFVLGNLRVQAAHRGGVHARAAVDGEVPAVRHAERAA